MKEYLIELTDYYISHTPSLQNRIVDYDTYQNIQEAIIEGKDWVNVVLTKKVRRMISDKLAMERAR